MKTTDLSDTHGDAVQVAEPLFRSFGGVQTFRGPISTLKVFEDNTLVRALLEEPGAGRTLVIDGGGSLRCALVGDQLGMLAVQNGWAGIIVYGCVRDSAALSQLALGIQALAAHPRRSGKRGEGQRDIAVTFAGVRFAPGDYLYADEDGIVVLEQHVESA
ncbi:ribonuclease E activity regulator RraA [Candidatus Gracilibacteria bacterium]|nr:ribonuclease E activity regulator RraA [Candidatus Gracilibacteria bacterium]